MADAAATREERSAENAAELAERLGLAAASRSLEWPVEEVEALGSRTGVFAWVQYLALRLGIFLLDSAPGWLRRAGISGLARIARRLDREHTDAARTFLSTAFPEELAGEANREVLERRVHQAWCALIRTGYESSALFRRLGADRARHYTVEGFEPVAELLSEGTGVMLVTAHVGNWEAFCSMLEPLGFRTPYVIGKPPKNRPLSALLQRKRQEQGVRLLPRQGAMREVPTVLAAGGTVGMLLDQRPRKRGLVAPFFGRPALCDRSAGVLLRRARVPVIFCACYRTDVEWRFRLVFHEILRPEDLKGLDVEGIAVKINDRLERIILEAPDQYLWLHDRYRGAPSHVDPQSASPSPHDDPAARSGSTSAH